MDPFDPLQRQQQKTDARLDAIVQSDKQTAKQKRRPPAIVTGYDPTWGYTVTEGGAVYSGLKAITNGTIGVGSQVIRKGNLIDGMRKRPVEEVEEVTVPTTPNIKYVYLTGGSSTSKTALCVAGYRQGWTVQIDEWDNSEYTLYSATIDNLGGSDFIVSYVLRKLPAVSSLYGHIFKVSTSAGIIFSQLIDSRYSLNAAYFGLRFSVGSGFTSPGYGNWVSNCITDYQTASQINNAPATVLLTTITGDTAFRLSCLSLNPQISQQLSLIPYQRNWSEDSSTLVSPNSYTVELANAYLNPELQQYQKTYLLESFYFGGINNGQLFRYAVVQQTLDTSCFRYNAKTGKSLIKYTKSDWTSAAGSFVYSGYSYRGWSVISSRGASINDIPFTNLLTGNSLSVASDYLTQINCTLGSDVATYLSGALPSVGSMVTGGSGFNYGTTILEINGSSIKLSAPATETTDLPDNPTSIYTGFISPTDASNNECVDLLVKGVSYFPTYYLSLLDSTSNTPMILSEPIEAPVSFYGDDLRPTNYKNIKVYPPKIINQSSGISYNFRILHASYSTG